MSDVDDEMNRLMMTPMLRRHAERMATGPDPALVARLWDEYGEWFDDFILRHWRRRYPEGLYPLLRDEAPARAVIAIYKEKRGQLAG